MRRAYGQRDAKRGGVSETEWVGRSGLDGMSRAKRVLTIGYIVSYTVHTIYTMN